MPLLEKLKLEMCHNIQDNVLSIVVAKMGGKLVIINCDYEHIRLTKSGDEDGEAEDSLWSIGDITEESTTREEASSSSSSPPPNSNESTGKVSRKLEH